MIKLRIIYLYLILLSSLITQAQSDNTLEKLQMLLSKSKPDKHRVDLLLQLGKYYLYKPGEAQSDLDSAMILATNAEKLSQSIQYKRGIYESNFLIGNVFLERNDIPSAIAQLPFTKDTSRLKLLLQVGGYYLYKVGKSASDLDSAAIYLQEGKTLSESLGNSSYQNECLRLLGFFYIEKGELQQGKKYLMEVIHYYQRHYGKKSAAELARGYGTGIYRQHMQYDESIYFLEQARLLYQQLGEEEKSTEVLKEIADIHLVQGKLEESEKELLKVIEEYKAIGFTNLHYTYDLLTAVNMLKGNLNQALFYGLEMVKSVESTGDDASAPHFYWRLGNVYQELGQMEKSIEWHKKALETTEQVNHAAIAQVALEMVKIGRAKEALAFVTTFVQKSPPVDNYHKSGVACAMGNSYNMLGQYELAEKYYLDMIRYEKLLGNQNSYTALVNLSIGEFYVNRHRYQSAMPYLKKILDLPEGIVSVQRLKDVHLAMFKVDSASGNYLQAIRHFQMHKILNDSLFNETKSKQIEELQIQYQTEQKEKDIQLLQNESQLQQSKLLQANLTKNITFGGITLLLIIVGLLYNRYRLKQRSNRQLEIQQIEINQTNQSLQNLLEEKEWLLREIHHRVKNNLQIVMSLLNTQSVYLESDAALSAIRDSQHRIRSISLIHQKLYQSNNVALIDMPTYIQELVDYLQDSFDTDYNIHFDLNIEPIELDVTQAVPVGLILNEAISNAIKYAFPNQKGVIKITMQQMDEDHYSLIIADDGVGLPSDFDINQSNSLGMSLMQGLSKQLNGSFEVNNKDGLHINIQFIKDQPGKVITSSSEMQLSAL